MNHSAADNKVSIKFAGSELALKHCICDFSCEVLLKELREWHATIYKAISVSYLQ
jgi:hypothetical protein